MCVSNPISKVENQYRVMLSTKENISVPIILQVQPLSLFYLDPGK